MERVPGLRETSAAFTGSLAASAIGVGMAWAGWKALGWTAGGEYPGEAGPMAMAGAGLLVLAGGAVTTLGIMCMVGMTVKVLGLHPSVS